MEREKCAVTQAMHDTCKKLLEVWGRMVTERALALREAVAAREGGIQQYH
jgi:hypothetical protein